MPTLEKVNQAEEQTPPDLAEALSLMTRWKTGARDEETALRLLFFCWYSVAEPTWLTGLPEVGHLCTEIFAEAGDEEKATPRVLLAVGLMAGMFPWAVGDEAVWIEKAERLERRAKALQPEICTHDFNGFGEAGRYFRHILAPHDTRSSRLQ